MLVRDLYGVRTFNGVASIQTSSDDGPNENFSPLAFSAAYSGVAIGGSAGSRNRGPRPLGAPDRESRETSNEHKS